MGNSSTGVIMCKRAIRYDARHVEARYLLGLAYIDLGQYEKAYSHMVALSSLDPGKAHLLESALQAVAQRQQAALLGRCLSEAKSAYDADWNSTCRRLGRGENCSLPTVLGEELNRTLRHVEDSCFKSFPQR